MTERQKLFCETYIANGYNAQGAYYVAFPDKNGEKKTNKKASVSTSTTAKAEPAKAKTTSASKTKKVGATKKVSSTTKTVSKSKTKKA